MLLLNATGRALSVKQRQRGEGIGFKTCLKVALLHPRDAFAKFHAQRFCSSLRHHKRESIALDRPRHDDRQAQQRLVRMLAQEFLLPMPSPITACQKIKEPHLLS